MSIDEQIQSCFNCVGPDTTIKRMVLPYYWFAYNFTRIDGIKFEGHDAVTIDCYDIDDICIYRVVTCDIK